MAGAGEGGVGITHQITVSTATSALDTAMVTSIAPAQPTYARAWQSGTTTNAAQVQRVDASPAEPRPLERPERPVIEQRSG